jgi:hypothetical protein
LVPVGVRRKRAVSDTFDVEAIVPDAKELSVRDDARVYLECDFAQESGAGLNGGTHV